MSLSFPSLIFLEIKYTWKTVAWCAYLTPPISLAQILSHCQVAMQYSIMLMDVLTRGTLSQWVVFDK